MTSSNGSIFRVTSPFCGEFTGYQWITLTKASDAELWCFFYLCPNKRLSKQSKLLWFETPSRSLWRHQWHCQFATQENSREELAKGSETLHIFWYRCVWYFEMFINPNIIKPFLPLMTCVPFIIINMLYIANTCWYFKAMFMLYKICVYMCLSIVNCLIIHVYDIHIFKFGVNLK